MIFRAILILHYGFEGLVLSGHFAHFFDVPQRKIRGHAPAARRWARGTNDLQCVELENPQ